MHAAVMPPAAAPLASPPAPPRWRPDTLMQRLGETFHVELPAQPVLQPHWVAWSDTLAGELGLAGWIGSDDDLLPRLAADSVDCTIAFRRLCDFRAPDPSDAANAPLRDLFIDRPAFDAWAARYAARLQREGSVDAERRARMQRHNPRIVLRNHLAEIAIRAARDGDFGEVRRLHRALRHPYDDRPDDDGYAGFPPDWAQQLEVSCSS